MSRGAPRRLKRAALALCVGCLGIVGAVHCDSDSVTNGNSPPPGLARGEVTFFTPTRDVVVSVEIADDAESRRVGLMNRQELGNFDGMIFVFPDERVRSFWMVNTHIYLDMIFIRADRTVAGIVENAVPLTEDSRSIPEPVKYVVEVNGGFASAQGITAGTQVGFTDIPD